MNASDWQLLQLLLKVAGYRRCSPQRRSSRSRRWSRSAQTLFASWAVLSQIGMVGMPLSHFAFPSSAHADNTIPNSYGGNPDGTGATRNDPITWWSKGSIAIGFAASAGYLTSNPNHKGTANGSSIAIGTLSNAAHYGSAAIGIGAASTRENQITLGATSTITGENGYTYAEAKKQLSLFQIYLDRALSWLQQMKMARSHALASISILLKI